MITDTLPPQDVLRLYDRIGPRYDWFAALEGHAKALAFEHLDLSPGMQVLDVGVGTGREHLRIQEMIAPGGLAFGLDLSRVMLRLCQSRTGAPLCQADACCLPYPADNFDRLYVAYVLDLFPLSSIPAALDEFRARIKAWRLPGSHQHDRGNEPAQPGDHGRLEAGLPSQPLYLRRLPPAAPGADGGSIRYGHRLPGGDQPAWTPQRGYRRPQSATGKRLARLTREIEGMDIKLTTQDVWMSTLVFGVAGLILLLPLVLVYRPAAFQRSAASLTVASALFWGVCATAAIFLAWDFYYRYIYPAWSRWLAPFDALFYGLVGLGMWWLALRLPGSPVVWFVILGGLEGVAEHIFGIYALHILEKVPWLSRYSAPAADRLLFL